MRRSTGRRLRFWALQTRGWAFHLRARGRRHHPRRICADAPLSRRAGRRRARGEDRALSPAHSISRGGWPLFHAGKSDISASVKAYFALKMIGDPVDAPHMVQARTWILERGGAANSNVFTRNLLALYGVIPWRGVPVMPVEIMLLPRWFSFHLDKVSYWARTVLVPLTVLNALKPRAVNAKAIGIDELFGTPPEDVRQWPKGAHQTRPWAEIFGGIDRVLQRVTAQFSAVDAQAGDRARRQFRHGAVERWEWARRDLSGDGECAADVRCARLSAGRSEGPHGESRDREFAGGQ